MDFLPLCLIFGIWSFLFKGPIPCKILCFGPSIISSYTLLFSSQHQATTLHPSSPTFSLSSIKSYSKKKFTAWWTFEKTKWIIVDVTRLCLFHWSCRFSSADVSSLCYLWPHYYCHVVTEKTVEIFFSFIVRQSHRIPDSLIAFRPLYISSPHPNYMQFRQLA